MLQIICTLHKWRSSLIRITSNGVVQMYYSICRVNLRNVGIKLIKRIAELLPLLSCKKPAEVEELTSGVVVGIEEVLTIEYFLG